MTKIGVVAIGRNEGERLDRCLRSSATADAIVYVDSGSADDSVARAQQLGIDTVSLDMTRPFTAARARNTGFERLVELRPDLEFVQFVDGDCEIEPEWLKIACATLQADAGIAVVAGRRRERHPERSVYNRLCDIEWDTPVGEAKACGGDAMMRVASFRAVGGFDPHLIAGEEPELCVRLRAKGWRVRRLDAEMTRHDAEMTRWTQWWRRMERAGHAYAEGATLHGSTDEKHWVHETRSIVFWGFVLPAMAVALSWTNSGVTLLSLLGYLVLQQRVRRHSLRRGMSAENARLFAWFVVLAKFPQAVGVFRFHLNRCFGLKTRLIEYKQPPAGCSPAERGNSVLVVIDVPVPR